MRLHSLLGLPILLMSAALQAAPVQLPCKLPGAGEVAMTNERHGWSRDGKPWTVTVTQRLHFERTAAGNRLTLGSISATGDLDPEARRRLDAAYGSSSQEPVRMSLNDTGQIIGVDDLAHHWQVYLGKVEQVARELEAAGQPSARAHAALEALQGADEATRIGLVAASVGPLLRLCGQSVDGTEADGQVLVKQETDDARLTETALYRIDPLTGLARSIERRVTVKAQPDKPQVERWRFDRLP